MTRTTPNPWLLVPVLLFAAFVLAVGWRLSDPPDPTIRSRMVGRAAPALALAPAIPSKSGLTLGGSSRQGKPVLVNVFASWCVPCIAEMPMLLQLRREGVTIDAIAIRDQPADIAAFLGQHGDPFRGIGDDPRSEAQIALGSAGVPETFLVDRQGIIRLQHVGPIVGADLPEIRAAWRAAQ
jgi:cytochrome c biogenesis protein CcmG, thiol:disulfide interchange protein DsbE